MNLDEYVRHDALGLGELVAQGEVTSAELADLAVEATELVNPELNAVVGMLASPVNGQPVADSKFAGVPTFLKDLGAGIAGVPQEMGSRLTKGFVSPETAYFTQQMLDAGFNIIGRTTCPEFGLTLTTETLAYGETCNPWNTSKITGGSSGGSAALVAAGAVPLAHTNDGGGSTRIPASICGNVGLKTSRGRVSLGPSINDVSGALIAEGCNSKTVRDTAAFLDAVSYPQPGEGNLMTRPAESFLDGLSRKPGTYKIALSLDPWGPAQMDAEIRTEVERIAQMLRDQGHHVEEATPAILKTGALLEHFKTLWFAVAEASVAQLAPVTNRMPGVDTLEPLTLEMAERGKQITALQYQTAMGMTNVMARELGQFFESWDMILTPTLNRATPDLGSDVRLYADIGVDEWYDSALAIVPHTPMANFTGIPAISVPCGIGPANMPLGMQFFAAMGGEATLLDVAQQLERSEPWIQRKPGVFASP